MTKQERIRKIMDDAAAALAKEKVKYLIGVVDRKPKDPTGGQAFIQSDVDGTDFCHILDMALPTKGDAINLGIWVGQIIHARQGGKTPVSIKKDSTNLTKLN